jgi:peptidoglycan-N-acetylglucosamine deacetylase
MKKIILSLVGVLLAVAASTVQAKSVAITLDNPTTISTPLMTPAKRDKAILATLAKHHLKIVLFTQGLQVDDKSGGQLLARWNSAGHIIGNHSYTHKSLNEVDEQFYEADFLRNQKSLKSYSQFRKIFRFPFLKEGDTAEKRDAFREFLKQNEYFNGRVTIDTSDWYINDRMVEKLALNPSLNLEPYKKYYLDHVWNRAQYYDKLATELLGRSPKHTLLVHHNLLNALFLADVIEMFKSKGWDVIDSEEAFKDPIFTLEPKTLPAGESLIWALAKESGRYDNVLRYPGEDGSYEKAGMDALGL